MTRTEPRIDPGRQLHGLSPQALLTIVCLIDTGVAAMLGSIFELPFGTMWGGIGGMLAGFVWVPIMLKLARKGLQRGRLVGCGAATGAAVWWMAAGILVVALVMYDPPLGMSPPVIVLCFLVYGAIGGVPAGAVTGALCGLIVPKRKRR